MPVEPRLRRIFIPDEEKSISRIDNIIRHCFQTRARDEKLGDAIYYEMFETLFGKEDRQLELRDEFQIRYPRDGVFGGGRTAGRFRGRTTSRSRPAWNTRRSSEQPHFVIGCAMDNEQLAAFFEGQAVRIPLAPQRRGDRSGKAISG